MPIISMLGTIVTVVFAIVLILSVILNVLKGLSKGLVHMVINIVFIFVSGLLAIAISVPLGKVISSALVGKLTGMISGFWPGYDELVSASSSIGDLMTGIPAVIVSVLLYFVVFFVLLALMIIPAYFIRKKLVEKFFPNIPKLGWAGALCGVLAGLALFVFVSAPITGTLDMIGDASSVAFGVLADDSKEGASDGELNVYEDVISPATDNFFVKFTSAVGGKAIFNSLTVFEMNGEKVSVSKEVSATADVFSSIVPLLDGNSPSEWTENDIDGIKTAAEKLSDSKLVSGILADVLSNAAKKWDKDEAFLGIKLPEADKSSVNAFLRAFFVSFKATTKDTVDEDIGTMADVLGKLESYGMLKTAETDTSLTEGFVSELLDIIMANERFRSTAATVVNLGIHETIDVGDVPSVNSEEYVAFVDDITALINEANKDSSPESSAQEKMASAFAKHNIQAEKKITDGIAKYLTLNFEGRTDVSYDEMDEFFKVAFGSTEDAKNNEDAVVQEVPAA